MSQSDICKLCTEDVMCSSMVTTNVEAMDAPTVVHLWCSSPIESVISTDLLLNSHASLRFEIPRRSDQLQSRSYCVQYHRSFRQWFAKVFDKRSVMISCVQIVSGGHSRSLKLKGAIYSVAKLLVILINMSSFFRSNLR